MARLALAFNRLASAEYRDITNFSAEQFGRKVADAYMAGLDAAIERLREFPELAPVDARYTPPTRCLRHRSHHVFYRVEPNRVLIVRILHQSRATPTAL